jgi:hypothetical protein
MHPLSILYTTFSTHRHHGKQTTVHQPASAHPIPVPICSSNPTSALLHLPPFTLSLPSAMLPAATICLFAQPWLARNSIKIR